MLSAVVFSVGLFGVITRRNTIGILLGIELMINAVNINLVAFARFSGNLAGMVFPVFTIAITVAEAALGLAIVILLFRVRRTVMADHLDLLKG
jgi:NADH-quinone oxidoreductase subunit K